VEHEERPLYLVNPAPEPPRQVEWEIVHIFRPRPHAPESPEESDRRAAEEDARLQDLGQFLRTWLTNYLAKDLLPFRRKTSSSSTPPSLPNPCPEK
jgi:hypothetical protein